MDYVRVDHLAHAAQADERAPDEVARLLVGVSAVAAGCIHLVVAPEHLREALPIGLAFLVLGLAQCLFAIGLTHVRATWALVAALLVDLGAVAAYTASRTVELPFMPAHDPGHEIGHLPVAGGIGDGIPQPPGARIEPVGPLDAVCVLAELVFLIAITTMLPRRLQQWATWAMLSTAVLLVLLRVVLVPG